MTMYYMYMACVVQVSCSVYMYMYMYLLCSLHGCVGGEAVQSRLPGDGGAGCHCRLPEED